MLIHKDGKTNLEQMDSTSREACEWIASKNITKVLMNPPYEKKCHPEIIIQNVLNNITSGALAAFLLPDKKLEKVSKRIVRDILKNHRLLKIIKLPEKTFDEGVTTSIFIFKTGVPQNNEEIFTCYIKDDGYETAIIEIDSLDILPKFEKDLRKARGIVKSFDFADIHGLIFNTIDEKEKIYQIDIYDSYNE